jgi:hypothetical protein
MHACRYKGMTLMNRIQRIGAQAVVGAFRTVATAVAEAEASIRTVSERFAVRATKLWVNLRTLPKTNPLSKLNTRELRRFTSPLQRIAHAHQNTPTDNMEVIQPYAIAPWEERLLATIERSTEDEVSVANTSRAIWIAISSSVRKGIVGMGGVIHDTLSIVTGREPITYSVTLGTRAEQNPYTAELTAMAMAMKQLILHLVRRQITITTSNQGVLLATSQPRHQSGQTSIKEIYKAVHMLRKGGNFISMIWVPSQGSFELGKRAKKAARQATELGQIPHGRCYQAKSTTVNNARAKAATRTLPNGVGKFSREMDTALTGKHTRTLYDTLKRREASVLAQLRTGMARLNGYLHQIGAAESDQCECGQARETIKQDSFCLAENVWFNGNDKFNVRCELRDFRKEEDLKHVPPISKFPVYMYDTGPKRLIDNFLKIDPDFVDDLGESDRICQHEGESPGYKILIKREGAGNPWHTLLEIFSLYLTLDALYITPTEGGAGSFFNSSSLASSQPTKNMLFLITQNYYFSVIGGRRS